MRVSARRVASLYLRGAKQDIGEEKRFKDLLNYIYMAGTSILSGKVSGKTAQFISSIYSQFSKGKVLTDRQKEVVDDIAVKNGLSPVFQVAVQQVQVDPMVLNSDEAGRFRDLLAVFSNDLLKSIYDQFITGKKISESQKEAVDSIAWQKGVSTIFSNTRITPEEASIIQKEFRLVIPRINQLEDNSIGIAMYTDHHVSKGPEWVKTFYKNRYKFHNQVLNKNMDALDMYHYMNGFKTVIPIAFFGHYGKLMSLNALEQRALIEVPVQQLAFLDALGNKANQIPKFKQIQEIIGMAGVLVYDIYYDRTTPETSVFMRNVPGTSNLKLKLFSYVQKAQKLAKEAYAELGNSFEDGALKHDIKEALEILGFSI
ncbi:hypothetical protein EB001_06795 [bacterium]|nr:hypothetical protein [bacterium]